MLGSFSFMSVPMASDEWWPYACGLEPRRLLIDMRHNPKTLILVFNHGYTMIKQTFMENFMKFMSPKQIISVLWVAYNFILPSKHQELSCRKSVIDTCSYFEMSEKGTWECSMLTMNACALLARVWWVDSSSMLSALTDDCFRKYSRKPLQGLKTQQSCLVRLCGTQHGAHLC